jgi:hypothetical protein
MSNSRKMVQPLIVAFLQPGKAYKSSEIAQSLGIGRKTTKQALYRLTNKGEIARRKVGIDCAFFATEADAAAWSDAAAAEFARQQNIKRQTAANASARRMAQRAAASQKLVARMAAQAERNRVRAEKAQTAPVTIAPRKNWDDTPTDMSRAKVTVAPAQPDYRWHVAPESVTRGAWLLHNIEPRWSDYALKKPT